VRNDRIGQSSEDYLKTIYKLIRKYGACRSVDIANEMKVSKSSVSIALKKLEKDAFIEREQWRILLTEKGQALAEGLYERNLFFFKWFKAIGINEKTAEMDACKVEHVLSDETYRIIREYITVQG